MVILSIETEILSFISARPFTIPSAESAVAVFTVSSFCFSAFSYLGCWLFSDSFFFISSLYAASISAFVLVIEGFCSMLYFLCGYKCNGFVKEVNRWVTNFTGLFNSGSE
jgi:hypothetical protein